MERSLMIFFSVLHLSNFITSSWTVAVRGEIKSKFSVSLPSVSGSGIRTLSRTSADWVHFVDIVPFIIDLDGVAAKYVLGMKRKEILSQIYKMRTSITKNLFQSGTD